MTSTLPQLVSPGGEVVRVITAEDLLRAGGIDGPEHLKAAPLEHLGTFAENADHLVAIAKEAKTLVGDETIRRMDRRGTWTIREAGLEFKASSPMAGTKRLNIERLQATLERLVAEDRIDVEASYAALEPPPLPTVPFSLKDVELLEEVIRIADRDTRLFGDAKALLGVARLELEQAAERRGPGTPKTAGINALKKLGPDVVEALAACEDDVDPPERKATIKRTRADDGTA